MESWSPTPEEVAIIGRLPDRWPRMDPVSQMAVLEVGRVLRRAGHLDPASGKIIDTAATFSLIGGSCYGSLATDQAYAAGLADGILYASPALFGYTLPNIALAEAASHYGITGAVFALLDPNPLEAAQARARCWLHYTGPASYIIYGVLDLIPAQPQPTITAHFHILTRP